MTASLLSIVTMCSFWECACRGSVCYACPKLRVRTAAMMRLVMCAGARAPTDAHSSCCAVGEVQGWKQPHLLHILLAQPLVPLLLIRPHHVLDNGLRTGRLCRWPSCTQRVCQSALPMLSAHCICSSLMQGTVLLGHRECMGCLPCDAELASFAAGYLLGVVPLRM